MFFGEVVIIEVRKYPILHKLNEPFSIEAKDCFIKIAQDLSKACEKTVNGEYESSIFF